MHVLLRPTTRCRSLLDSGVTVVMSALVMPRRHHGAGLIGNGCVGALTSPGHLAGRHLPFLDAVDRFAGEPIEDEQHAAHFRDLRHGRHAPPVADHVDQRWSGREIGIEDIVMRRLKCH